MSDTFKRKSPSNPTTGAHMQDEKFTPTTNPDATTPASDTFKSVLKQAKCLNCGAGLLIESIKTRLCPTCERDLERTSRLTGVKHDAAKPRHSLLPHSIDDIIAVLEYGAAKYGERNWELGMEWSRPWNAALRHLWAWWRGEECDKESGLPHLAHAAVNCMFLLDYAKRGLGRDDRP